MKTLGKALRRLFLFLLVLELVFVIHEYGHFTEMKKKDIPVEEFSLGIGPSIYQWKINDLTLSLRFIPIMAYVAPTKEGLEIQKRCSLGEKFVIYFAGVRNNLFSGIGAILFLNFVGWRRGLIEGAELVKRVFYYPIKAIWMFVLFSLDTLTFRKFKLGKNCKFSSCILPPEIIKDFIFLSFLLGFLNFMPFYPLDGGKIFIELMSVFVSKNTLGILQTTSQFAFYFFLFFFGISKIKFMD